MPSPPLHHAPSMPSCAIRWAIFPPLSDPSLSIALRQQRRRRPAVLGRSSPARVAPSAARRVPSSLAQRVARTLARLQSCTRILTPPPHEVAARAVTAASAASAASARPQSHSPVLSGWISLVRWPWGAQTNKRSSRPRYGCRCPTGACCARRARASAARSATTCRRARSSVARRCSRVCFLCCARRSGASWVTWRSRHSRARRSSSRSSTRPFTTPRTHPTAPTSSRRPRRRSPRPRSSACRYM